MANKSLSYAKRAKSVELYAQFAVLQVEIEAYLEYAADAFAYNARSEVTAATVVPGHANRYEYDFIGNNRWASLNVATNLYSANNLNQYTQISTPLNETALAYDSDGNLTLDGAFSYAWNAENRLIAVYSNATCIVSNAYDHQSRRVRKITPATKHTYFYDGWNLIRETTKN